MGVLGAVVGRHPHAQQQVDHDVVDVAHGGSGVNLQRLRDRLAHAAARVQACVGVLEDDLRLAPERTQFALTHAGDVDAVDDDRAAGGVEQADDEIGERGLAAAALADDRQRLAAVDAQADLLDGVQQRFAGRGELFGQTLHDEQRLHGRRAQVRARLIGCGARTAAPDSGSTSSKRRGRSSPAIDPRRGTAACSERV